jgi:hypothetical protein
MKRRPASKALTATEFGISFMSYQPLQVFERLVKENRVFSRHHNRYNGKNRYGSRKVNLLTAQPSDAAASPRKL